MTRIQRSVNSRYLAALNERVLIFDGAMGTNIDPFNLTAEDYGGEATFGNRDYLVITRPDVIEKIHTMFLDAGCDVIETCTFQSTRIRLEEWGLGDRTAEINRAAASLARKVADRYAAQDGRPRFVAGSIGPTGKIPSSDDPALSDVTFDQLSDYFFEQAQALIEGGVDVLLTETNIDILELKAALDGIRRAKEATNRPDVAVQAQIVIELSGRMLFGTEVGAAIATLQDLGVDVIGMNCSTGPEHMRDAIRTFTSSCTLPISCIPNAGLPLRDENGNAYFPMEPEPFAEILEQYVKEYGVSVVGGCCGTRPAHIAALRQRIGYNQPPKKREVDTTPHVSSGMGAVSLHQDPRPLMIGERVNSLGSRKVKRLLLKEDYDAILEIARDQIESGAHTLDVCVATTERADEAEQMVALVRKLAMSVDAPLVFDSTESEVLEAALKVYPGRAILNSTSLEGGRGKKIDQTLPLAVRYGAAVIAIAIDEEGMAHKPEDKLRICRRIYEIATQEYGLSPDALIFDVNVFPITTGQEELRDEAWWTIEGVRLVKQHLPGALTSLGVSNLSFGVAPHARAALNSVFLYHAVQAGLDMAIINPAHVTPYAEIPANERELCEDLIFNRREDALARFIQHFDQTTASEEKNEKVDPTAGMSHAERIHWKIVHRKKDGVEQDIDNEIIRRIAEAEARNGQPNSTTAPDFVIANSPFKGPSAVEILNDVLLPAMKEVGDKFGAGELILPFVLQSAEVMKKAVAHLEQYLDRLEGTSKGKVVLATVYGDVHDIGKSLVNTILSNNGYTVYDLGKQVPVSTIIEKAIEYQADAIGLSALLVSTSKQMPLCVQELNRQGLQIPVLVGGAAINKQYGQRIMFIDETTPYTSGVFYCKDAFEGLEVMDKLSDTTKRNDFIEQTKQEAAKALAKPQLGRVALDAIGKASITGEKVRSNVRSDVPVPTPPFWGTKTLTRIRIQDVLDATDRNALYRLQWGAKNKKGEEWEKIKLEFDQLVKDLMREAERENWLDPKVVYGYFPVQSDGHDLIVYDPVDRSRELTRFVFPRQPERERLCLSDYFRSVESGEYDVAAFQVVTMGTRIDDLTEELQKQGDYTKGYYLHGLSVSLAEGLAEYTNRLVQQQLGIGETRGKRYSWGYPACPDLEEHTKLFKILPTDEIGVSLTDAYQLIPEQSTAAIVVHHPEAKYFSIGSVADRAESDVSEVLTS